MAWNDTPLAPQQRNITQAPIRQNLATIKTAWDTNHYALGDGVANDGKHKIIQLPEQGADPGTAVNEGTVYTKEGATSSVTELFFQRENGGSAIPMTEAGKAAIGWTYLPSGLLVKWGSNSFTGAQDLVVNWGPDFTTAVFNWALVSTKNTFARSVARFVSCTATGAFPTTATLRIEGKNESTGADYNTACTFIIMGY